jgi:hypothetical protein
MNAIDMIRSGLIFSEKLTVGIVQDLREHALVRAAQGNKGNGGNHTLWTLGHLATIEANIPKILFGETDPLVEKWGPLFGVGSEPKDDASIYPSFDELLNTYRAYRAKTIRMLDRMGEADLERVPKESPPPGFEKEMGTVGQMLQVFAMHNMVHYGQLTDMRRAAGFKPRF